jgi:hypothetical protein
LGNFQSGIGECKTVRPEEIRPANGDASCPVMLPVQLRNVIAFVDVLYAGRHSHGQQQTWSSCLRGFAVEFCPKFLMNKVALINSDARCLFYLVPPDGSFVVLKASIHVVIPQ